MSRFSIVMVVFVLAGCVMDAADTSTNMTPLPGSIAILVTVTPSPIAQPNLNALTGLTVPDASVLERRPLVVKISNAPALVRPQAGISAADIVYEHYTEGGLTRFSAVFYSQAPQRVGSIRSARLIDNQLVPMYNGLLAFSTKACCMAHLTTGVMSRLKRRITCSSTSRRYGHLPHRRISTRALISAG
jgi:hypothetical protein